MLGSRMCFVVRRGSAVSTLKRTADINRFVTLPNDLYSMNWVSNIVNTHIVFILFKIFLLNDSGTSSR